MRRRLGVSQAAFGRAVGITRNAVMLYERGVRLSRTVILTQTARGRAPWRRQGRARAGHQGVETTGSGGGSAAKK